MSPLYEFNVFLNSQIFSLSPTKPWLLLLYKATKHNLASRSTVYVYVGRNPGLVKPTASSKLASVIYLGLTNGELSSPLSPPFYLTRDSCMHRRSDGS